MTDQRMRDLERDAAHGDLQGQARLLLERVRVGNLTEERLRLAAYLGDPAARAASAPPRRSRWEHLGLHGVDPYFVRLDSWGPATKDRANCALAHALMPFWLQQYPDERWLEDALRAEERRVVLEFDRADEARAGPRARLTERAVQFRPLRHEPNSPRVEALAAITYHTVSDAIMGKSVGKVAFNVGAFAAIRHARAWARRVIRREVVPWALGHGDPLRERLRLEPPGQHDGSPT